MRYQSRLDALRGICITAVFLYHFHFLEFGWAGVQAFFVLSGYLITGILLEDKDVSFSARGYFSRFYARRALRIFPVYFAYLAVAFALASSIPGAMAHWVQSAVANNAPYLLTYTVNFHRLVAPHGPFLEHLWSLSVEEQFYLAWPLVVFCIPRRGLANTCLALVIAGPVIRLVELIWLKTQTGDALYASLAVYFSTFSHIDAFALGALLNFAAVDARIQKGIRVVSKWIPIGFALISVWMLLLAHFARYDIHPTTLGWPIYLPYYYASVWGYTLLNTLFFVVIANLDSIPLVFENAWLKRLGRISYGFYIFHLPILSLTFNLLKANESDLGFKTIIAATLAFCLTWAVSAASYRYIETPFLRMKQLFASPNRDAESRLATDTAPSLLSTKAAE